MSDYEVQVMDVEVRSLVMCKTRKQFLKIPLLSTSRLITIGKKIVTKNVML